MTRQTSPLATLVACVALFLGSFGDEAAQVTFALRLAEGGASASLHVSALLATGLLGGIAAGMRTPRALLALGAQRMIAAIFVTEAALIAAAAFADTLIAYLAITAVLGCLGSMLWSAVLVFLLALNMSEAGIGRANRVVQSVRNLGYVVGPLLGSVLYAWSSGTRGLLVLGAVMLCSAIGIAPIATRASSPAALMQMRSSLPGGVRTWRVCCAPPDDACNRAATRNGLSDERVERVTDRTGTHRI